MPWNPPRVNRQEKRPGTGGERLVSSPSPDPESQVFPFPIFSILTSLLHAIFPVYNAIA